MTVTENEVETLDDFLAHYGVKGMKWGVKRKLSGMTDAEGSEYLKTKDSKLIGKASDPKKLTKVAKVAHRSANSQIKALNKEVRSERINLKRDSISRTTYDGRVKDIMESSFNRAAEKVYGKSKTGLIEVNISRDPSTFELSARVVPRVNTKIVKQLNAVKKNQTKRGLAHADSDDEFGLDLLVTTDEDGFMVEFDVPDLEHFDSAEEFLAHYGVKGMKWGRRRTDAQLERAAAEREAGSDSGTSGSGSTKSDVVSIDAAEAAFTEHMLNKYGAQSVSNAQLQSYVNRRQLEERYEATKPKAPPKPESKLKPAKEFMSKLVADVAKEQITRVAKARAALEVERRLAKNAKNSELVDRIKPKDKKKKD